MGRLLDFIKRTYEHIKKGHLSHRWKKTKGFTYCTSCGYIKILRNKE